MNIFVDRFKDYSNNVWHIQEYDYIVSRNQTLTNVIID